MKYQNEELIKEELNSRHIRKCLIIFTIMLFIVCLTIYCCMIITANDRIEIKKDEEIENLRYNYEFNINLNKKYQDLYYQLKEDYCTNPNNNNYKEICK